MKDLSLARAVTTVVAALALASFMPSRSPAQMKVTSSGGNVSLYTQKNLVDHMIVGDSVEVEMAELAVTRTQNANVRDLARQFVADHRDHLDKLRKLAKKHEVGRESSSADTSGSRMIRALTMLQAMPADASFDRIFVREQITHHLQALDVLNTMKGAATEPDVQKDIDRAISMLTSHLARARQVEAQLGLH